VQNAEQMQKDDDEYRHAGQPQDDVAKHKKPPRLIDRIGAAAELAGLMLSGADARA
jgi:hypothetical protein